jgi:hypothetical protein
LFLAIKFLGAYYVNLVMNFYFFFVGVAAVGACVAPFVAPLVKSVGVPDGCGLWGMCPMV